MISLYETTEYTGFAKDTEAARPKKGKAALLAAVFLIPALLALSAFVLSSYYTDFANKCFIKIRSEVHNGNADEIKNILSAIRFKDSASYREICENVSAVHETYCVQSEANTSKVNFLKDVGCYLNGSGYVFLRPLRSDDKVGFEDRVAFMIRLAKSGFN
ncbi:hypothetical protein A2415_02190 [candidate division WWE3 bacterium RIFOXYC1_FULL_39_7]|uniref:Uncharacterized protein n=2 Tax=Katanobacteria TaxID=422282 RepID=A0A1F4X9G7_UNCKA|nr:MAG: hypothetical protein A2415_02190 [candidate division WWE3 bacterium RIFOXYC1_FULL_39_7]OGC78171.1 MAG: hypothetical protein A2619_01780 [candidate division WWE3 bacterium RIFOXYD1_FULL_39_9]